MAHTPGPWDYQNDTIASTHGDIARVHYQSSRAKKGWDDRPLIAAAPDLLSALKAHLPWDEDYGPVRGWGIWQDAVDAINKAEGKGE